MSMRVVIVGGGFGGAAVARRLERRAPDLGIQLVCPDDYMLYQPLLPQVAAGVLPPRAAAVPLTRRRGHTRLVPGRAVGVDLDARRVVVDGIAGDRRILGYDRLVLAPGSVTKLQDVPGLRQFGFGCKTLAEAEYLRDHILAQLELAAAGTDRDEVERRVRFVVVGGGYAGVETAAHLELMTRTVAGRLHGVAPARVEWHLVQHAGKLMPGLDPHLGRTAHRVLSERGVRVHLDTGIDEVDARGVRLSDGHHLPAATVIWTAGVTPSPLMQQLDAPTEHGRLVVDTELAVPGRPEVLALGDAAAVPDLAAGDDAVCPPTAQHATRQAPVAADNVLAGLGRGQRRSFRHHDLGLVADLGDREAVASPLDVDLTGLPAHLVARAYHLWSLGAPPAQVRVLSNWVLRGLRGDAPIRLGFASHLGGRLDDLEHSHGYLPPAQARSVVTGETPARPQRVG